MDLNLDKVDLTAAESKATCYVKANPGDCRAILKAYGQYFTIKEDLDETKQREFTQKFRICA